MPNALSRLTLSALLLSLPVSAAPAEKAAERWAHAHLQKLSLREKIGQMIMPWMEGGFKNVDSYEFQRLKAAIETDKVGGFIVFRGSANSIAELANRAQALSNIPLFFAADFETGLNMQTGTSGTSFTSNMGLGATGDAKLAFAAGKVIGRESRAIGVNWVFAPVADVNNNPDNPVINTRSFGEDPEQVGRFTSAMVRGIQEGGALSTLKHFPGHGDTGVDSHVALPAISGDLAHLETVELVPFRAAIQAGAASVMIAHITAPKITNDSVPATLNPKINRELLRGKLGFQGLIVTDAMEMGAITKSFAEDESAVMAVEAGADVVLLPLSYEKTLDTLEGAVKSGRLTEKRIDESVLRILLAKFHLGLAKNKKVNVHAVNRLVMRPESVALSQEIADKSITLLKNEDHFFPYYFPPNMENGERLFIQLTGDTASPVLTGEALLQNRGRDPEIADLDALTRFRLEMEKRIPEDSQREKVVFLQLDRRSTEADYQAVLAAAAKAKMVVLASYVRRSVAKGAAVFPPEQEKFLHSLLEKQNGSIGVLAFGSPYQVRQFQEARNVAITYGMNSYAVKAAARALLGEIAIGGSLPIQIPGLFPLGAGLKTEPPAMP